ncbi:MAG: hypothetical protein ACFWT0_01600 [Bifidobacterium crudilactis]|jgi:hypothetical protein|uniref:hypothetical protein n=1 Tax=Bifidobacterium crudilactis TaxID=327277 RepID=UPI003A5C41B5
MSTPPITSKELAEHQFTTRHAFGPFGRETYDSREVDDLLDRAALTLTLYEHQMTAMTRRYSAHLHAPHHRKDNPL